MAETKHTPGKWEINGGLIEVVPIGRPYRKLQVICVVGVPNNQTREDTANARLIAAAPMLLPACTQAAKLIETARQYFPKSMHNSDKFQLEQTCAAIGAAIAAAENEQ